LVSAKTGKKIYTTITKQFVITNLLLIRMTNILRHAIFGQCLHCLYFTVLIQMILETKFMATDTS